MSLNPLRVASLGLLNLGVVSRAWPLAAGGALPATLDAASLPLNKLGGTPGKKFVRGASSPANIFPGGCPAASVFFRSSTLRQARLARSFLELTMLKANGRTTQGRLARRVPNVPTSSATSGSFAACAVEMGEERRKGPLAQRCRRQMAAFGSPKMETVLPLWVAVGEPASLVVECKSRPSAAVAVGKGRLLCSTGPRSLALVGVLIAAATLSACAPIVRCVPGSTFLACGASK